MLKPLIIIPSRLGSTRLQKKALKMINGQPMICHVWSNALKADLGPVVVATDSEKISNVIEEIFNEKISDGQLSDSPITFKELATIKESFQVSLEGLYHQRVLYPEITEEE